MATWSSPDHPEHPLDHPPNQTADTEWETIFLQTILKWNVQQESHYNILTAEKYGSLLQEVKEAKTAKKKTSLQYRRLKRFDVIEIGGVQKLIASSKNDEVRYYVPAAEIFEVIKTSHVAIGHGGRDRLKCEINRKYANVTADMIKLFLTMCEVCQSKKNKKKRGLVSKPILHSELNSRCQVDLIDMQTQADGKYKFIMVYQDHLTKFVILRALQCKRAEEVAYHLVDIFLTFGAPCILQSDNGREFVNSVITSLASLWPELKIVHGKPRHSQSQGSVERANQDIENMLSGWMKDNDTARWSEGLRFVQFMKNRAHHSGINRSPYKAMFGVEPRVGLATTCIPRELINVVNNEEDLEKIIAHVNKDTVGESNVALQMTNQDDINSRSSNRSEVFSCCVCEMEISEGHYCSKCGSHIHESCGINVESGKDGFGSNVICLNCNSEAQISHDRQVASTSLKKQAKRMKTVSDASHPPASVGQNVTVPIPDVDKGKGDLRNIIAVVLNRSEDELYKLGTRDGILKKLYSRSEFDVCKQLFIDVKDIPTDKEISLRSAATSSSVGTGQGFFRCHCTKHCATNICKCKKYKVLCNSKCHNSMSCKNK